MKTASGDRDWPGVMPPAPNDGFEESLRRALRQAADCVEANEDGLARIFRRLAGPWLVRQVSLLVTDCVDLFELTTIWLQPMSARTRAVPAAARRSVHEAFQWCTSPAWLRTAVAWLRPALAAHHRGRRDDRDRRAQPDRRQDGTLQQPACWPLRVRGYGHRESPAARGRRRARPGREDLTAQGRWPHTPAFLRSRIMLIRAFHAAHRNSPWERAASSQPEAITSSSSAARPSPPDSSPATAPPLR